MFIILILSWKNLKNMVCVCLCWTGCTPPLWFQIFQQLSAIACYSCMGLWTTKFIHSGSLRSVRTETTIQIIQDMQDLARLARKKVSTLGDAGVWVWVSGNFCKRFQALEKLWDAWVLVDTCRSCRTLRFLRILRRTLDIQDVQESWDVAFWIFWSSFHPLVSPGAHLADIPCRVWGVWSVSCNFFHNNLHFVKKT